MFKTARYSLLAVMLAALLCGCGAPSWGEFDEIRLGAPLPNPLPGDMEFTTLGAGYIGAPGGTGSFFGSDMRIASAIIDSDDSVVAKSCLSVALSHRVLYVQTTYRYVIETYVDAPGGSGSKAREALQLVASASQSVASKPSKQQQDSTSGAVERIMPGVLGQVALCVSTMEDAVFETRGTPDSSDISRMRNKKYAGASIRFSKALNQSLAIRMAGQRIKKRLGSLPSGFGGSGANAFTPSNIPETMLYKHILLNSLARPSRAHSHEQTHKIHAMYLQYAHPRVLELLADPDTYRQADSDGFDKKWRTLDGMTVRVTRTGRALGVEITGTIVRDSVMTDADMGDVERTNFDPWEEDI